MLCNYIWKSVLNSYKNIKLSSHKNRINVKSQFCKLNDKVSACHNLFQIYFLYFQYHIVTQNAKKNDITETKIVWL